MPALGESGQGGLSLEGLKSCAARLLASLPVGAVVWLEGELGTGKTTCARLLVDAAGGEAASSPTFALVNEYSTAEGDIYHADCYRLRSEDEAVDLDLWRLARQCRLLLVEWPHRAGEHVPPPTVKVKFGHADDPDFRIVSVLRC